MYVFIFRHSVVCYPTCYSWETFHYSMPSALTPVHGTLSVGDMFLAHTRRAALSDQAPPRPLHLTLQGKRWRNNMLLSPVQDSKHVPTVQIMSNRLSAETFLPSRLLWYHYINETRQKSIAGKSTSTEHQWLQPIDRQRPYSSHPSDKSPACMILDRVVRCSSTLLGGNSLRSSSPSHNSSSSTSNSEGFSRPPTLERRSRSAASAACACCSFSCRKSSVLSPAENSRREMRKSRKDKRNLSYWVL